MIGQKGVIAIKTGVTNSAGPCLATAVELDPTAQLVIVLLGCKDMDCRWCHQPVCLVLTTEVYANSNVW